jgi:hypothetical protein
MTTIRIHGENPEGLKRVKLKRGQRVRGAEQYAVKTSGAYDPLEFVTVYNVDNPASEVAFHAAFIVNEEL